MFQAFLFAIYVDVVSSVFLLIVVLDGKSVNTNLQVAQENVTSRVKKKQAFSQMVNFAVRVL